MYYATSELSIFLRMYLLKMKVKTALIVLAIGILPLVLNCTAGEDVETPNAAGSKMATGTPANEPILAPTLAATLSLESDSTVPETTPTETPATPTPSIVVSNSRDPKTTTVQTPATPSPTVDGGGTLTDVYSYAEYKDDDVSLCSQSAVGTEIFPPPEAPSTASSVISSQPEPAFSPCGELSQGH